MSFRAASLGEPGATWPLGSAALGAGAGLVGRATGRGRRAG